MITSRAAISACEKGKQPDKALELHTVMQRKGLAPGMIIYSAAISACEKGEQLSKALELLVTCCGKAWNPHDYLQRSDQCP